MSDKWVASQQVQSYPGLRQLLIFQDIKNGLPVNLRIHLEDRRNSRLAEAAFVVNDYVLIHKAQSIPKGQPKQEKFWSSWEGTLGTE